MTIAIQKTFLVTLGFLAAATLLFAAPAFASAESSKGLKDSKPGIEIHLNTDGKVLVRGATVTVKGGSSLTATTAIGPSTLTFTVNTDAGTQFINRGGGKSTFAEIAVGDSINFSGSLATGTALTVNAKIVKDTSVSVARLAIRGSVSSIDPLNSRFTVFGNGTTTVQVASSTALMKDGASVLFSVLAVGDFVQVSGSYNAQTQILTAQKIAINMHRDRDGDDDDDDDDDDDRRGLRGIFKNFRDKIFRNFRD